MTSTEKFQKIPDYFDNEEECKKSLRNRPQTNPRYREFTQTHFTAGDAQQFEKYRNATNGKICSPSIDVQSNLFQNVHTNVEWEGYSNLPATSVQHTFSYIFNKFKKGIFVKIQDNKLKVFLPFSKSNFTNEWGERIQFDPKYGSMEKFIKSLAGKTKFTTGTVNRFKQSWNCNNCILRYEYPLLEGDSGTMNIRDMLKELCDNRIVPDIEFFVNRRDFPILKKDRTEPYNHIFDSDSLPLISHAYDKYSPIFGGATTDKFADIPMPTWFDWQQVNQSKYFPKSCKSLIVTHIPWNEKTPTAVFRGGSTGCGVTQATNPRLKVSYLSISTIAEEGYPLIDAGITNWNIRPRKLQGLKYLQTIDINKQPPLVQRLTPQQQAGYKYIINIDGHVTAYRLSNELSFGSVILLVQSNYYIWYMKMLKPYQHYIPIKRDLSDLVEKIRWCRDNDGKCQQIAINALNFYKKYICKNGIFDYLQKLLINTKTHTGIYMYNYKTPLEFQLERERIENRIIRYPSTSKTLKDICIVPPQKRSYSLLKGLEWIFNMIKYNDPENVLSHLNVTNKIFESSHCEIFNGTIAEYPIIIKQTKNNSDIVYCNDKENIHETFIGVNCINNVLQHIPNFVYILGSYETENNVNVVVEQIKGITLFEYLKCNDFDMDEYLFILLQISLSLQVAQNICGFVHWDTMPWNIIIHRISTPTTFDYIISHNNIVRVTTNVIPVIIDYGKSHVIYNDIHYGMINMYKMSTVQDILSILFSSVYEIINSRNINNNDMTKLFKLMNFISLTTFYPKTFYTVKDILNFIRNAKKFSVITTSDKHELEDITPIQLVDFILTLSQFPVQKKSEIKYTMDIGNSRQIFDFVLSKNISDRLKSYSNVFIRLKKCKIPQPDNLFFLYYVSQLFDSRLRSLYCIMEEFLNQNNIDKKYYKDLFDSCMSYISHVYTSKIKSIRDQQVSFYIDVDSYKKLHTAKYNSETFLLPDEILTQLNDIKSPEQDLSEYKTIIDLVISSSGRFKLSEKDKVYYVDMFRDIININTVNMKTNIANVKTLVQTSRDVFSTNLRDIGNINYTCIILYHQLCNKILSQTKNK